MQNNGQNACHVVSEPAVVTSGQTQVGAVVLNVSATGAQVRLTSGAFLNTHCVPTTALLGEAVPGRIVWRRGTEIGLRFRTTMDIRQERGRVRARSRADSAQASRSSTITLVPTGVR